MTARLLLDVLGDDVATQLRASGRDVQAAVADPDLVGLPDAALLAHATAAGRTLVTRNIKDFVALDAQCRAIGTPHAGLVLVSTKSFPQVRRARGALVRALDALLDAGGVDRGAVVFLPRVGRPRLRARAAGVGRRPTCARVGR